ncbi:beta-lactamase/transpeptidase-like protein [Coniochaeta sp. 2T2.1]|nr:beta-lactamase/transpeptidase-like protein [Coniochaeta sp. 2T2.1]
MAQEQARELPQPYTRQDLEALGPTIQKLMDIAGTGGLVVGVQRDGDDPWYWCSDIDPSQPGKHQQRCREYTMFPIFSLTKLFTSMCVARWLAKVSDHTDITWDTCVEDVEPKVNFRGGSLRRQVKIIDLLSHNTGMTKSGCYRGGSTGMLIDEKDYVAFINDQAAYRPANTEFYYNNLGYKHAGHILDQNNQGRKSHCLSGWSDILKRGYLLPWRMYDTSTEYPGSDGAYALEENHDIADGYHMLETGEPVKLEAPSADGGTGFAHASGGMYSCAEDLLGAYMKVKRAIQGRDDAPVEIRDPDKKLFTPQTPIEAGYGDYCLGLVKVEFPGRMGYIGLSKDLMTDKQMPVIGNSKHPLSVYYHQGSGTRGLAGMAIVPDLDTVVVVLSNTLALNDCADWVLQLVMSTMLGGPASQDFIKHATITKENNIRKHRMVRNTLNNGSKKPSSFNDLASCRGIYTSAGGYLDIEVEAEHGKLYWTKHRKRSWDTPAPDRVERFQLYHYEGDTFHWLGPRREMAARGIWVPKEEHYWVVTFHVEDGNVKGLTWLHDPHNPRSGKFKRVFERA